MGLVGLLRRGEAKAKSGEERIRRRLALLLLRGEGPTSPGNKEGLAAEIVFQGFLRKIITVRTPVEDFAQQQGQMLRSVTMTVAMSLTLRPLLESVLGPLTEAEDAAVRGIFAEIDVVLLDFARHFGRTTAGNEGTGLELSLAPMGQVAIESWVAADVASKGNATFYIQLRPSWYYGAKSASLTWEVETEVYADCQHSEDHGSEHLVYQSTAAVVTTAGDAARALRAASIDLARLGKEVPVHEWLLKASDSAVRSGD